jgi:hypothetical protein
VERGRGSNGSGFGAAVAPAGGVNGPSRAAQPQGAHARAVAAAASALERGVALSTAALASCAAR